MAFMFEARGVMRPMAAALALPTLQADYAAMLAHAAQVFSRTDSEPWLTLRGAIVVCDSLQR
jgi:hypothetical protein